MSGGFSFIHAADLHLDSPFRGFEQVNNVDEAVKENVLHRLRNCTFKTLENIVDACIRHNVDFLVLSGDIYDLADRSIRAELRFRRAVERLARRGIQVYAVYGNHDYDDGIRSRLTWPDNVFFFSPGEVEYREITRQGKEVARIYGISYPRRDVTDNYAVNFKRHSEVPFAIGVLHCNVGGIPEHENYAPCHLNDLVRAGMDYWALGHVHTRQVLKEDSPCVVYAGSPQGRSPRETGEKGCYLVNVSDNGLVHIDFLPVDDIRWIDAALPVDKLKSQDELISQLVEKLTIIQSTHGNKSLITRITLTGRSVLHRELRSGSVLEDILEELRNRFAGAEGDFLWPESIRCATGIPLDKASLKNSGTLLGDLLTLSSRARSEAGLREELRRTLWPLEEKAGNYLSPTGEAELTQLLEDAEDLVIELLWEDETY